jgi:hypothetical protein
MDDQPINEAYDQPELAPEGQALITKSTVILLVVSVVIFVGVYIFSHMQKPLVKLSSAPALYGQVYQSINFTNGNGNNSNNNNGFSLSNTNYFTGGGYSWAASKYTPNNGGDSGVVVLQKVGDFYIPVMSPGSAVPSNVIVGFPTNVQQYVRSNGYVYAN